MKTDFENAANQIAQTMSDDHNLTLNDQARQKLIEGLVTIKDFWEFADELDSQPKFTPVKRELDKLSNALERIGNFTENYQGPRTDKNASKDEKLADTVIRLIQLAAAEQLTEIDGQPVRFVSQTRGFVSRYFQDTATMASLVEQAKEAANTKPNDDFSKAWNEAPSKRDKLLGRTLPDLFRACYQDEPFGRSASEEISGPGYTFVKAAASALKLKTTPNGIKSAKSRIKKPKT